MSINNSIPAEFVRWVIGRKRWWLLPLLGALVALGTLIVFTEGSAVAPFIYALF